MSDKPHISSDVILNGPQIPPLQRIQLFSADDWEAFINEWLDSLKTQYIRVERLGGSGDKGRDVVATVNTNDIWDNYQCKHYNRHLQPGDIWTELGKLVYYTFIGEYTCPRKYYFVAPQGVGTTLRDLLKKPESLRTKLIENWEKYCTSKITSKSNVILDSSLKAHLKKINFSIFTYIPPLTIINQHATTRHYAARFGGGLPLRPKSPAPPDSPHTTEANYIHKLMDAYSEHTQQKINSAEDIPKDDLREHYKDARIEFYCAESLKILSRDNLDEGEYEKLQDEIHAGIKDELRSDYPDGYKRVMGVVKTARCLQLTSHPLVSRMHVKDRGGICHQLANDKDEVKWVKDD